MPGNDDTNAKGEFEAGFIPLERVQRGAECDDEREGNLRTGHEQDVITAKHQQDERGQACVGAVPVNRLLQGTPQKHTVAMKECRTLSFGFACAATNAIAIGVDERQVAVSNQFLQLLRTLKLLKLRSGAEQTCQVHRRAVFGLGCGLMPLCDIGGNNGLLAALLHNS